jgi:tetratricopeptide (TPR) repeat protein
LPFYPYSLDVTAGQSVELDSVIYKSTAGILLHDLRTDWVDNLYLLIGKAYFYRKIFDSAALTFQFINYNLFPRKKNEDDNRIIGTNNTATSTKLSIADKEKRNLLQRTFTLPPSRNDALIWLSRTYIEMNQYGEAAGMINILQEDPNLPKRLKDDLNEITAYWFYRQGDYDSTAKYLELAISDLKNKTDKSRWQFLLGQLYEKNGKFDKANFYFTQSGKGTLDPLMDIYAHLNNAKMLRDSGNSQELEKSILTLLAMSKKDKFEAYQDIIFHSAGVLSMKKPDTAAAVKFFEKSLTVNENNIEFKNKAHLELGRIAYLQREYKSAADHYDSLDLNEPSILPDSIEVADRKSILRKVANQYFIISNEDSLQMVASLPPAERDVFIKKIEKKIAKEKSLTTGQEVTAGTSLLSSAGNSKDNAPTDLFASSTKGEWYFYNSSMKSKGFNEFKSKWGKRDNLDNWRRKSAMGMSNNNVASPGGFDPLAAPEDKAALGKPVENSYDALMLNLPLTSSQLDSSNIKIANALIELARIFQYELQDYQQSIYNYELYLKRFPDSLREGEIYLGLYYCYIKLGDHEKAAYYKNLLDTEFANAVSAKKLNDPTSLEPEKNNPQVSKKYQEIYNLFLDGFYDSAFAIKKRADSIYGKNYWTPQLLYLEAMYYIKCVADSQAMVSLNELIGLTKDTILIQKAMNLIEILGRRNEIETYLADLQVTRVEEEDRIIIPNDEKAQLKNTSKPVVNQPKINAIKTIPKIKDSAIQLPPSMISGEFKWQPDKRHNVLMLFDQVESVYINEARNAYIKYNNSNNFSLVNVEKDTINAQLNSLVFRSFESASDAFNYFEKIKKASSTQLSWLQSSKYSFIIVDDLNLQLLKKNKDIRGYRNLLNVQYPGKF